jgi:Lon-like ATP-dependent protease
MADTSPEPSSGEFNFETTEEIDVPEKLIDQVIGQDEAVDIIRLAANQRRFVMLMGQPGTGKSMLGAALSELLPSGDLKDLLAYQNPEDPNLPIIEQVPAGNGEKEVERAKDRARQRESAIDFLFWSAIATLLVVTSYLTLTTESIAYSYYYVMGALVIGGILFYLRQYSSGVSEESIPKLLVNNADRESAPFIDATGAHEGALFGDVRHDPYQSGGSQTPPHHLVEVGAIHRANGGVLYIDEVSTLDASTQQSLLTAVQEQEFPITGRTPGSSGSMVRTEPVPCNFVLVLAGNLRDLEEMHPALRSRIRGYGYEILTNETIEDTHENHKKIARFVAQEVEKDGTIPHFTADGVRMILREAHRRSDVEGRLTGRLRDLGGLVRASGDVACMDEADYVCGDHVQRALENVKTLEEQLDERPSSASRSISSHS